MGHLETALLMRVPPCANGEGGRHVTPVPEGRPTIAHRFNGGYRGQRESSPVGTKETPRRDPGNVENLCRPYGTRQHFRHVHPALKRWAIIGCPDGASGNRVAHARASLRERRGRPPRHPSPGGTPDNSPPFQRWVSRAKGIQSRRDERNPAP